MNVSLKVTALSPLSIRSDHAEGGVQTTHAIPGTTLLGSLASAHRILRLEDKGEFEAFFLGEQVHFPQLYPALFSVNEFLDANVAVLPIPKTAQTCKRYSGFLRVEGEKGNDERHGVRDMLLDWGAFSLLKSKQAAIPTLLTPFKDHELCTYAKDRYSNAPCHQVMDHIDGYYRRGEFKPQELMKAKVDTRLQTRTGINREWGVVEERILYNRQVFEDGMIFWGEVTLPDELADRFKRFVEEATEEDVIRVGTGRTRGLGRVKLEMWDATEPTFADFTKKLDAFNIAMKQVAREAEVQQLDPFYFAITLQSPLILRDAFLRYSKTIDAKALPTLLEFPAPKEYTFRDVYQSVAMQRITGWNELWGTPRPNEYAMEKGSTFLFACEQQADENLMQALHAMEVRGIGERRSEGFGRISISDHFHLEREQA